jgi:hypothetical protein
MFTPFAFVKSAAAPLNPIAISWAATASISNTSVISAVSTFVNTLQTASIWSKMVAIYPMITDSDVSATAKSQFTYNLVNPATHTATYLTNNSTGSKSGLRFAGNVVGADTFITITPATIGNNYVAGLYTNSDASLPSDIDMGVYDDAGGDTGYLYIVAGRDKSAGNAQILLAASDAVFVYNQVTSGPFTGLFGVGGNSTTGYAYRRTTQLATAAGYNNAQRGVNKKIGLGSLLQENTTALAPSSKIYQFAFMSTFLDTTEFGNLATAVNDLQGSIDIIFATSRKAYT